MGGGGRLILIMGSTKITSTLQQIRRSSSAVQKPSYVWIDLEMTGLDPEKDKILEIACIITNSELQPIDSGIHRIIHHSEEVLNSMNSWSAEHHLKTGLTEASRNSKVSISEAEKEVSEYIKTHSQDPRHLAGNSVYMDKMFLMKHMPCLDSLFHYRLLDVSCIKLLCSNWYSEKFSQMPKKKLNHRALDDILESIQELKYYRREIFK